jgi:tetratricopeptide (TPR) repeat protein
MKSIILAVFGTGILVGSAYVVHHKQTARDAQSNLPNEEVTIPGASQPQAAIIVSSSQIHAQATLPPQPAKSNPQNAIEIRPRMDAASVNQAVELLVSAHASHEQKQAVWKQLKHNGALDQAISELEHRTAGDPSCPECAAALGQAYLQKCGTISDVREQGILAMQADKVFDSALSLDPANWEARFTKAVALSYWPATMNKGDEVIQHFTTLVQQQETQPPQPQFADTYVWLGDQYQKMSRTDDARSVWERGAALFPSNDKLQTKLASLR